MSNVEILISPNVTLSAPVADEASVSLADIELISEVPQGPPGQQGERGETGPPGPAGSGGGNTILYGTTEPTAGIGDDGDFYIRTTTHYLYGPKAGGVWPAGVSMVGGEGGEVTLELFNSHVNDTSNPHAVTAAQTGAPTLTAFNNHTTNNSNPHSVTAAQVGAPTLSAFSAHTGNTSNPHSVTAAQVGAYSTAQIDAIEAIQDGRLTALEEGGGSGPAFGVPSGEIGLTAVNGVALTALRSDARHALSQTIVPFWKGMHRWQTAGGLNTVKIVADGGDTSLEATGRNNNSAISAVASITGSPSLLWGTIASNVGDSTRKQNFGAVHADMHLYAGWSNQKNGAAVSVAVEGAPAYTAELHDVVGTQSVVYCNTPQSVPAPWSVILYGMNPGAYTFAGGTGIRAITGGEVDVCADSGAPVQYRYGWQAISADPQLGRSGSQGSVVDAAFSIGVMSQAVPWRYGIYAENGGGRPVFNANSTFIMCDVTALGVGMDLSQASIVNFAIKLASLQKIQFSSGKNLYYAPGSVGLEYDTGLYPYVFHDAGHADALAWNSTSDRRAKADERPLKNGLKLALALQPKRYKHRIGDRWKKMIGFVADDVLDVLPELVSGRPTDDRMMSMDYGHLAAVSIAAIQELHARVAALEGK